MNSIWLRKYLPRIIVAIIAMCGILSLGLYLHTKQNYLHVLCSNNYESCAALVESYEQHTETKVKLVRLPTSKALDKLTASASTPEFDVFIGGPAEAYERARKLDLIQPHQLQTSADPRFSTEYWIGTYGGILAFCIDPKHIDPQFAPHSWQELISAELSRSIALPSPLSSGTAATMLDTIKAIYPNERDFVQYLRQLHQNTLTYTDSGTNLVDLVADGRASIAVTFAPYCQSFKARQMQTIYPKDGTSYEIGAAAIVKGGDFAAAQKFLKFAVSDSGQALVASIENQNPISANLPNNLADSLAQLDLPVMNVNATESSLHREWLMRTFAREVLYE